MYKNMKQTNETGGVYKITVRVLGKRVFSDVPLNEIRARWEHFNLIVKNEKV